MSAHTPGPWHVKAPQPARYPCYGIFDVTGENLFNVPILASGKAGADAALVAAAPDMLAALEAVVAAIPQPHPASTYEGHYLHAEMLALENARTAIAKAKA